MDILTLEASDFCCFEHIELPLHNRGLVWLGGANMDTEAATSNGSGKTSIFKALGWGIYGKAIDGKHGDEVIRDGAKCAAVGICYEDGWRSVRTRHRGAPRVELITPEGVPFEASREDIDTKIVDLVGMDFHAFHNTVLYGQDDKNRFIRTDDRTRKTTIHNILRTRLFFTCHKWIKEQSLKMKHGMDDLVAELTRFETARDEHDLDELEAHEAGWEDGRTARVKTAAGLARDLADLAKRTASELPNIADLESRLADLESAREMAEEADADREKLALELEEQRHALAEAAEIERMRRNELDHVTEALVDLNGEECPTCMGPLTEGTAKKYIEVLKRKAENLNEAIKRATVKVTRQNNKVLATIGKVRELETLAKTFGRVVDDIREVDREISEASGVKARAKKQADEARAQIAIVRDIKAETNPYSEQVATARKRLKELEAKWSVAKAKLDKLAKLRAHYEFWVRGFSGQGLPSFVLDSVMPYLTNRANHYLETLADGDITMSFRTQRELKSAKGEFRDELDIQWEIEGVAGYPPSGGQFKKMEIATDLALMDLVATREGGHLNILCLDECLDGLDSEGRNRVVQLLHDLRSQRGTIFVISHDPEMAEVFERSVMVTKQGGVATVKEAA
jgi:DNA repair exonuclease SbcCD ATPase subunit